MNNNIKKIIDKRLNFINARSKYMIGYPEYIGGYLDAYFPKMFKQFIINCGNPFTEADNYSIQAKDFEREVLYYFMDLYKMDRKNTYGYICNGSTEGTLYALYRAREVLDDPVLFFSESSHYSVEKVAKILKIPYQVIPSNDTGSINIEELQKAIDVTKNKSIILSANLGTILKGAIDDIPKIHSVPIKSKKKFHIHIDAALFGGYLPFIDEKFCLSLMSSSNSIALSIHKFFGLPISTGLVLVKNIENKHSSIDNNIDYINSFDSTILGSRNGAAAIMAFYVLKSRKKSDFAKDVRLMLKNAQFLFKEMRKRKIKCNLLRNSNTVYFDKLPIEILNKWQLAWHENTSHVVVMSHVTRNVIKEFLSDLDTR